MGAGRAVETRVGLGRKAEISGVGGPRLRDEFVLRRHRPRLQVSHVAQRPLHACQFRGVKRVLREQSLQQAIQFADLQGLQCRAVESFQIAAGFSASVVHSIMIRVRRPL